MSAHVIGGQKLDALLNKMQGRIKAKAVLHVGFPEGATEADGMSSAQVAFWNEFGTSTIPPRPFFRTMIKDNSPEWGGVLAGLLKHYDYDSVMALTELGKQMEEELRESIVKMNAPELSQVTLMLRKMRKKNPDLIVTGKVVGQAAARVHAGESVSGVSTKPLIQPGTAGGRMIRNVSSMVTE